MPRPRTPLRYRLKAFPPPERIIVSGNAATIEIGEGSPGTVELRLKFAKEAGHWALTDRIPTREELAYELTSAWGIEIPDAAVHRVFWQTMERWDLAERVFNPPARVPFPRVQRPWTSYGIASSTLGFEMECRGTPPPPTSPSAPPGA